MVSGNLAALFSLLVQACDRKIIPAKSEATAVNPLDPIIQQELTFKVMKLKNKQCDFSLPYKYGDFPAERLLLSAKNKQIICMYIHTLKEKLN